MIKHTKDPIHTVVVPRNRPFRVIVSDGGTF
jgi:hypothetical protein